MRATRSVGDETVLREDLLREGIAVLAEAGIGNAENEAIWLLDQALGTSRLALRLERDQPVSTEGQSRARAMIARRASHEPTQYILGSQEFCGLEFSVCPDVLIPRPETELLVEELIHLLSAAEPPISLADVGTGSGCVAVALARVLPGAVLYATDLSEAALAVAARNAIRHGVAGRVTCLAGDLLEPLRGLGLEGRLAAVVSNPPYIPEEGWADLPLDVRAFEPRLALAGGADGLAVYRRLIAEAQEFLVPGGWLILELGVGQSGDCLQIADAAGGYGPGHVTSDGAGIARVLSLQKQ